MTLKEARCEHHKHSDNSSAKEEEKKTAERMLADAKNDQPKNQDITDKEAEKKVNDVFGALTITDTKSASVEEQKLVGKPNEIIQIKSGDKTSTLELDDKGMPKQFNDRNGDKIVKHDDGSWYRESMLYSGGEKLSNFSVDADRTVSITYQIPKDENKEKAGYDFVKRDIKADGTEKASYDTKSNNGAFTHADTTTETTRNGPIKTIVVQKDDGQPLQSLKFDGKELTQFIAPDQSRYEKESGTWKKYNSDNSMDTTFVGKVKADSNGAVKVTYDNEKLMRDHPELSNQSAMRFLPDGTKVQSDQGNPPINRTITTSDGTTIQVSSSQIPAGKSVEDGFVFGLSSVTVSKKDGTKMVVSYDVDGKPSAVSLNNAELTKQEDNWLDKNGQPVVLQVKNTDGSNVSLDSAQSAMSLRSGDNPIEHRTLVQELPEDYQTLLDKRLAECSKLDYRTEPWTVRQMFKDKTQDSGDWDDKQDGGQYQRWGNVAWGMYQHETRMPYEDGIWFNGAYKTWYNGKSADGKWGSPWDWYNGKGMTEDRAYGQNPADAKAIKVGYDQVTVPDTPPNNPYEFIEQK